MGTEPPSAGSAEPEGTAAHPVDTNTAATAAADTIAVPRSPVDGTAVLLRFVWR
ncbi:hypothetical protein OG800_03170 [Streptomyces sp. NBC_00445]|uniref:hypothetical protein n=1 Tax=Streptomyces sp. NBC_00445 TaxID=2975745 RepID=UPI002E2419AD